MPGWKFWTVFIVIAVALCALGAAALTLGR
jgi:hypothetical protein